MNLTAESKSIIENSDYHDQLLKVLDFTEKLVQKEGIELTDLQWTILLNHLNEMIQREETHSFLPQMDESLFSEVSDKAKDISRKVSYFIGKLPESEVLVLSIHFQNGIN